MNQNNVSMLKGKITIISLPCPSQAGQWEKTKPECPKIGNKVAKLKPHIHGTCKHGIVAVNDNIKQLWDVSEMCNIYDILFTSHLYNTCINMLINKI